MTHHSGNEPESSASSAVARALRLRAEGPRVTRLSRNVLIGGTALALILVCGAMLWALQNNRLQRPATEELYTTDRHSIADGLAGLPRDYAGIPRNVPPLGPPLPGDLGRPMVSAPAQPGPSAVDPDQQRRAQETEAARVSRLFAATNARQQPAAAPQLSSYEATHVGAPSTDEAFAQNGQDRKLAFVNAPVDRRTTSPDRLARPASPYVVQAGTVIPAALITGLRSDLPGQITAQVTEKRLRHADGTLAADPAGCAAGRRL